MSESSFLNTIYKDDKKLTKATSIISMIIKKKKHRWENILFFEIKY